MNTFRKSIKIFSANSNPPLAAEIAKQIGIPVGRSDVIRFSDGEIGVSIYDSVRGCDVFIIQSTSNPVNDNLMELLIMADAFKRASAGRITAVIPYFGYARQDRKAKARDPISAKLVADIITAAGVDRILTMDLHAPQIQGFFNIPVDHLMGSVILAPYLLEKFAERMDELVIVSPDLGSVARARTFAERCNISLAIIDKRRPGPNVSEVCNIIGDVKNKIAVLIDDMIDTGGTIANAAKALMCAGEAREVYICATHGVLSGEAPERLNSEYIKEVVLLDTINIPAEKRTPNMKVLTVAKLFASTIDRIYEEIPVTPLINM